MVFIISYDDALLQGGHWHNQISLYNLKHGALAFLQGKSSEIFDHSQLHLSLQEPAFV